MRDFAVFLKVTDASPAREELDAHIAYLQRLRSDGVVLGNGRLLDGDGGLVIFRANTREEVETWVKQDPFVISGARSYEVYEWGVKWSPVSELGKIREIEPKDLKARLASGEKPLIIDVREDEEVAQGKIDGVSHIRLGDLPDQYSEIEQADEIFVVCRGGRRSLRACEFLEEKGFQNLYNIAGGMTRWNES